MKVTDCPLALAASAFVLSTLALAQSPGTCPPTIKSPKPSTRFCGAKKVPVPGKAATKGFLASTIQPSQVDCLESCFGSGNAPCKAFTYRPSDGTCNTYKYAPPRLAIQDSTDGTRFWNNNCYNEPIVPAPPQFYLQISGGEYDGQYVDVDQDGMANPAEFSTVANSPGAQFSLGCNSELINLALDLPAQQASGTPYDTIFFYTSAEAQEYNLNQVIVSCIYDNSTETLSCSDDAGSTLFACYGSAQPYYNGIAIAEEAVDIAGPGGGACDEITLLVLPAGQRR